MQDEIIQAYKRITEKLHHDGSINQNECLCAYNALIRYRTSERLARKKYDGREVHHIIPKSIGGRDVESNRVVLEFHEHFMAHVFLYGIYKSHETMSEKMLFAMLMMGGKRQSYGNKMPDFSDIDFIAMDNARRMLRNAMKGRLISKDIRGIKQWSKEGVLLNVFRSQADAARTLGIQRISIYNVLHGKMLYGGGFVWTWIDEDFRVNKPKLHSMSVYCPHKRPISKVDIESGVVIQTYGSYNDAARCVIKDGLTSNSLHCVTNCIRTACETASRTAYGYKWRAGEKIVNTISQVDENGNVVATFNTTGEAASASGLSVNTIQQCISGRLKTAGGFSWKRDKIS